MTTALLDAAIFMYAGGRDHPLRAPCRTVLERAAARQLDVTTSAEVVQEILHRYVAIRRHQDGVRIAREALQLFQPVLPMTDRIVRRVPDLVERYPALSARDLVHVATCLEEGIDTIISPDTGFDSVAEIARIDPRQAAA
jgi:predicted nucleic acid-binding protein